MACYTHVVVYLVSFLISVFSFHETFGDMFMLALVLLSKLYNKTASKPYYMSAVYFSAEKIVSWFTPCQAVSAV